MNPPRVLHVIGGGDTGGAMSHLLPLLSALQETGCAVHLLCLGEGGLADAAERRGLSVAVLPMSSAYDPRMLRPLRQVVAAPPPWDIVHTHGMRANLPVRLVTRGLSKRPCLLTTVHSDLRLDYGLAGVGSLYQRVDRATLGWVDGVICVSASLRALLIERGYPADRLRTVHSGLERSGDWEGDAAPVPLERTVANASEGRPPRVGTVARLVAVKDLDLALEVAGLLRRTHPQVEMAIVGDGPERERLQEAAAQAGLGGVVTFTGRLDDVASVLGGLDVYLVTSLFEGGVSMSILEAMAAGLPVVSTAAGGAAEAVVDGKTGYVVTRDQERGALAAALAERAAALLDDPALRARMGAAGARRVRAHFTADRAAARTLRVYERCLAVRGGRS